MINIICKSCKVLKMKQRQIVKVYVFCEGHKILRNLHHRFVQCTEVRFVSFLSGGFDTMSVINPQEKKLAERISVQWRNGHIYDGDFAKFYGLLRIHI